LRDDQLFGLVAMLCMLFWVGSNALPMRPELRSKVRLGAWVVLALGLLLALFRLGQHWFS
jgi:hypothetical protein